MGSEFTIYDFVDGNGSNPVHNWLNGLSARAKARFSTVLYELQAKAPADWKRPWVGTLGGECRGLWEIRRFVDKVQYRLLGFYGPGAGEFTLVFGAIEKDSKFEPRSACRQALGRKAAVLAKPDTRRTEHDFT